MSMTVDEIIWKLGGPSNIASELGITPMAVSQWKTRGLPKGRYLDLLDMATRYGERTITLDAIRHANDATWDGS
jgi:DNA-binding transcriptional regulator Cro